MNRKISKPAILIGAIIILFLFLLRMALIRQERVKEVNPDRSSLTPIQKETRVKVWLEEKAPDHLLLVGDSGEGVYDTFQLVFKTKTKIFKDFFPSNTSNFSLMIKSLKEEEAILLFSTGGAQRSLEPDKPEGEFLLFPRADLSGLVIEMKRSKVVRRGEEFPIDFEGVKK